MNIICTDVSEIKDIEVFKKYNEKYSLVFDDEIIEFFINNNGGIPNKRVFEINEEEYEIRCFLSFNENEYNSIDKSFEFFQKNTNGKIYPIAKDSGDNYYCINKDSGKVYYWSRDDDMYYYIVEKFSDLIILCS